MDNKLPPWFERNLAVIAPELLSSTLFKFKVKLQVNEEDADGKVKAKTLEVNMLPEIGRAHV